jgi:hypothetical protein
MGRFYPLKNKHKNRKLKKECCKLVHEFKETDPAADRDLVRKALLPFRPITEEN